MEPRRTAPPSPVLSRSRPPAEGWRTRRGPALATAAVAAASAGALGVLQHLGGWGVLMIPFVASAVVVSMASSTPLARPRTVLLAHAASAVVGLTCAALGGPSAASAATAGAVAVAVMVLLGVGHPPAAASAILTALTGASWTFLVLPMLPALLAVLGVALVAGRVLPGFAYASGWR